MGELQPLGHEGGQNRFCRKYAEIQDREVGKTLPKEEREPGSMLRIRRGGKEPVLVSQQQSGYKKNR